MGLWASGFAGRQIKSFPLASFFVTVIFKPELHSVNIFSYIYSAE
jgi:hypothetical protein